MKVLIAEDEVVCRSMLADLLTEWGHEVMAVADGMAALHVLQSAAAPGLAILDWQMPGLDGVEVCRRARQAAGASAPYLILLTARQDKASIVTGLRAGADDYLNKPFDPDELHARLDVGIRMRKLQRCLELRVQELERSLVHVKRLQGILPICMQCKKVRNDRHYWQQVEVYLAEHEGVLLSHGYCPECAEIVLSAAMSELDAARQKPRGAAEEGSPGSAPGPAWIDGR